MSSEGQSSISGKGDGDFSASFANVLALSVPGHRRVIVMALGLNREKPNIYRAHRSQPAVGSSEGGQPDAAGSEAGADLGQLRNQLPRGRQDPCQACRSLGAVASERSLALRAQDAKFMALGTLYSPTSRPEEFLVSVPECSVPAQPPLGCRNQARSPPSAAVTTPAAPHFTSEQTGGSDTIL